MIPACPPRPEWVRTDPVATHFRTLFAQVDWSLLPPRDPDCPGPHPHPAAAYLKALLVKGANQLRSIPRLRLYLLEHPALVWELGFHRGHCPAQPAGFPVDRLLPQERWLRHWQHVAAPLLQQLLCASAQTVATLVPDLDTMTALDATHHLAWVKHNNQNQSVPHRFVRTQHPTGDPDCRLGAKTRHPRSGQRTNEAFWGYHSAVVTTDTPGGAVVLGATVQPVVAQEVQLVHALIPQVETSLGHPPAGLTADAAFDAGWVWNWPVAAGGVAAIAHNPRGGTPVRSPDGHPLCAQGHPMRPTTQTQAGPWPVQHYGCPLVGHAGATCPDPRFPRRGCHKRLSLSPGAQARRTIDRTSPTYRSAYRKRTGVERICSQIKAWGLATPCGRSLATVRSIVLVGYLLINLSTLRRLHALPNPNV